MKRCILIALSAFWAAAALLLSGCVREDLPDNRDLSYGYVQFKLYKEASYDKVTKAAGDYDLDSLSQASKINVMLSSSDGLTVSQTLTLSASSDAAAEFGMRSSKLRLLKGEYEVASYQLYDHLDSEIGGRVAVAGNLTVIPGGLSVFDLTASVAPRGMIRFNLSKDFSSFEQDTDSPQLDNPVLRSADSRSRQYTFDEIAYMDITLINADDPTQEEAYKMVPIEFSEHFKGDEHYDGNDGVEGFQSSSSKADSVVYAAAGNYKILKYNVYDSDKILLETEDFTDTWSSQKSTIVVEDNVLTEAEVPVTLYEADEYLQDNYALYILWKALGGEHWSYHGESYTEGCNWNFNKDPDLWSDQPGVMVHGNGRVASIDLSGFGISGNVPAAIGQFTELVQLTFGSHSETNRYHAPAEGSSAYPVDGTEEEKAAWIENEYRTFAREAGSVPQMSPVCALALREHGIKSVAASMYDDMTADEISRMAAGGRAPAGYDEIKPYDMNHGTMTNALTSIHENIRYCTRLETFSLANSPIEVTGFPSADAFRQLTSLTSFEIYNCPNLETLPDCVAALPSLITVNLSNNEFDADGAYKALDAVAGGASQDVIQILYFLQNGLEALPESVGDMASLGMLNVSQNNIQGVLPAFGEDFSPEELTFDNNAITEVPDDFCSLDVLSTFSINSNKLRKFPNIFSSDERNQIMTSISMAHNEIKSLPDDFKGVRVVTLTLSDNPFETFPKELAETDSYVEQLMMQSCGMKEFPKGCLGGKNTHQLTTLDLQYNNLTDIPDDFSAETLPYLYGMDLSCNSFSKFPLEPLNILRLTAFSVRGQRNSSGERCLSDWPEGLYTHTGLRGFYIGSNDLRVINDDTISYMIYYLDISDNPNIVFDAADVCSAWQAGAYILYYDPDQEILNCDAMLE